MDAADLENRFTYHPPRNVHAVTDHETIRGACHHLALVIDDCVPEGREKDVAIERLEETMMWANAGIARDLGGD